MSTLNTAKNNSNSEDTFNFDDLDFSNYQSSNRVSEEEAAKIACSLENPEACELCQA